MNIYGWEKYHLAVEYLNSTSDEKRIALENAYLFEIMHVTENDIPASLWSDLARIQNALSLPDEIEPIGGNSGCKFAISILSDSEVDELISSVHKTFETLDAMLKSGELDTL